MTTKQLEKIAYKNLWKQGTYLCFEIGIPNPKGRGYKQSERVDLLSYETRGIWRFYELKISKPDFNSDCKLSWYGHFNYYIMPSDLYEKVKDEIPNNIGVYLANENGYFWCVKKPKRQKLMIEHDSLMFALMQGLSREYKKYRKLLKV